MPTLTRLLTTAEAQFKVAKEAGLVTRYFQQTRKDGWSEAAV